MTTNEAGGAWDGIVPGLTLLRKPFPPNQISYLPKGGVKLAYVGHAALTDRLLDADPSWSWEPLAFGPEGLPALDGYGGMWIKLTVCGVTRYGYGHAGTKEGGDAIKELIGDALRNAAMRFGAALDLWHKGDLHADEEPGKPARFDTEAPRTHGDPLGTFSPAWAKNFRTAAQDAIDHFNKGDEMAAYEDVTTMIDKYATNQKGVYDQERATVARLAIWGVLHDSSTLRSAIKRIDNEERARKEAQAEIRDLSAQVRAEKAEA